MLPHDHGQPIEALLHQLPKTEDFQGLADIFKQLSDGTRLRLFWLLCHCEECVTNLSSMMGMSSPALSHHLKQLKNAGLVVSRRSGKEVYYRAVDTDAVRLLHDAFEGLMAIQCPTEQ
jgi:DNA-binding transcriptional ArsR family regulator